MGEGSFVGRFCKLSEDFEEETDEPDYVSPLRRLFSEYGKRRKKSSITSPIPINASRVLWEVGEDEVDNKKGPTRNIDDENSPTDEKIMDEDGVNREMIPSDEVVIKDGKRLSLDLALL